ncbi:MAG: chemotaxis response regulator protein-glutamate methylesterase [Bryobacter sp.]|nr:chemotaxis response regulator protein-glutamate methylesterase [Bryobacter sp.]
MRKRIIRLTNEAGKPRKIRVMLVDNSVFVHKVLREVMAGEPDMEVAGVAFHGGKALEIIKTIDPDVLVLDVDMPVMDGLEVLRQLQTLDLSARVIMYSGLTERAAGITLEALRLGADDYAPKGDNDYASPAGLLDAEEKVRQELIPKIRQFFQSAPQVLPPEALGISTAPVVHKKGVPTIVAIASSTGGPVALAEVLPGLPANLPQPVLVAQHMPAAFTPLLAKRLAAICALQVDEARHGEPLLPGKIYLAPGDQHMKVIAAGNGMVVTLDRSDPVNGVRPSADVLFRSLAGLPRANVLALVMTGMGRDGARGAAELREAGATIWAQDEATSTVWGMPGTVVRAGLAEQVHPLPEITKAILNKAMPGRQLN